MMNRKFSMLIRKIVCFLLSIVITVSGIEDVSFLIAAELPATTDSVTESIVIEETEKEIVPLIIAKEEDISNISMDKIIFSLKESNILDENTETTEDVETDSSKNLLMEQVYTINVTGRGGLYLAVAQADTVDFISLEVQIYSDNALTEKIGESYTIKPNTKVIDTKDYYLKSAGTYYLKFTYQGSTIEDKSFALSAAFMYSTNRTLTEGKNLVTYADSNKRTIYYKVNIKKARLLSYTAIPEDGASLLTGYVTLCDENKKAISVTEYVSGSQDNNKAVHTYYTVKSGTYYLRVKLNSPYIACITKEKIKDAAGAKMNAAKKIVLGGKKKAGVLYFSDNAKTEKWYQFRLKKSQNFSIVINSCVNGYLNVEVCNANGATVKSGSTNFYTGTKILKTSSKWQKGTYYIKIAKDKKSKKSSGYFNVSITA